MSNRDGTPLIDLVHERTAEIRARCRTVERACAAIGFAAGSTYERIAALVARVAGDKVLRRTTAEIADDPDVDCSPRQVRRAVEELESYGVLSVEQEAAPQTRRRGRPPQTWLLRINWQFIRDTVAEHDRWAAEHRGEVVSAAATAPPPSPPEAGADDAGEAAERPGSELAASPRHGSGTLAADRRHPGGKLAAKSRHRPDHTILSSHIPPPPPLSAVGRAEESAAAAEAGEAWERIVDAVRDAGVERVGSLIREAKAAGMTPAELADAAYVVAHTDSLSGGALFDHVRHGGWPQSGVRPAQAIRDQRRAAAEAIRTEAAEKAPPGTEPDAIVCVGVKRLRAAGLADEITPDELATFERHVAALPRRSP